MVSGFFSWKTGPDTGVCDKSGETREEVREMKKKDEKTEDGFLYRNFREEDLPILAELIRKVWGYEEMLSQKNALELSMVDILTALSRADYIDIVEKAGRPVGFLIGSFRLYREKDSVGDRFQSRLKEEKDRLRHSHGGRILLIVSPLLNRINRKLIRKSHTPYFAELSYLALDASCRKKGIGRKLCERFENCLATEGINGFFVKTDTMSNYHFYDRMGFRRVASKTIGIPFVKKLQISFFLYEKSLPHL